VVQKLGPVTSAPPITQSCPQGNCIGGDNFGNPTVYNVGNIPPPSLILSDTQCQAITESLRPFTGQTVEIVVSGSMVNDPFPTKLQGAIEAAGLTVQYTAGGMVVTEIGTPPPGLSFEFGEKRRDILNVVAGDFKLFGLVNKPMKAVDIGSDEGAAITFVIYISPVQ